jgi:hypothetical protein
MVLRARERHIALAVIAFVLLEATIVPALAFRRPNGDALFLGALLDLLLFTGGALYFLARGRGGFQQLKIQKSTWLRGAMLGTGVALILVRALGVHFPGAVALVPVVLELGMIVLFVTGAARLPKPARAIMTTELGILAAAGRALLRRPLRATGDGAFTTTRESTYPGIVLALVMLVILEAIPVHFLLASHPVAQLVVLAVHVYSVAWIVGDLRAMRDSAHRCEPRALVLHLGMRGAARIPYRAIARVTVTETPRDGALHLTPADAPNLLVETKRAVVVRGLFGIRKKTCAIHLYVDDPRALALRIERASG